MRTMVRCVELEKLKSDRKEWYELEEQRLCAYADDAVLQSYISCGTQGSLFCTQANHFESKCRSDFETIFTMISLS